MCDKYFYPIFLLISTIVFLPVTLSFAGTVSQSTAEIYYHQGNQYLDQGLYELAVQEYQKAIQSDSKYRPAYRKLGDTYRYLKNHTAAIDNHLKFVGLSNDTTDTEGKQLLFEVAKICDGLNDSENVLRTIDGLLRFYYPDSLDKVETTVQKYRDRYLLALKTTPLWWFQLHFVDSFWQQVMFLKAKTLQKLGRNKKAFEVYSQYYTQIRYRDLMVASSNSPIYASQEWRNLYFENMSKPKPDEWQQCPWVIVLSPQKPEYTTTIKDTKRFEDSISFELDSTAPTPCFYIVQAKLGYRITKLELSAEIEHKWGLTIFPFAFGYSIAPSNSLSKPLDEIRCTKSERHWKKTLVESTTGIHAMLFIVWRPESRNPGNRWYQWKMRAEFIPELSLDTSSAKIMVPQKPPHLKVLVHPPGKTTVSLDGGFKYELQDGMEMVAPVPAGWHTFIAERPGLNAKEIKFYWDANSDYIIDIGFNVAWHRETTNLQFPKNLSEINLFRDNNGIYRLLAVASPDGHADIYGTSSQDLLTWSPIEKLSLNAWMQDASPRIIQHPGSDMFYLVWKSNRSGTEELWESTSIDFQSWSRPTKILTPLYSWEVGLFSFYREKFGWFRIFYNAGYIFSADGITWSKPQPFDLSNVFLLSNGRYLAVYGNSIFLSYDGKEFQKTGTFPAKFDTQFYQLIEFDTGELGLISDSLLNSRCLSRSKDFIHWSEQEDIVSPVLGLCLSNFIKDDSNQFVLISGNGERWTTEDLK
jgi:tetratricopeptide (TPR) repeat protein